MRLKRNYAAFFRQKYDWFVSRFRPLTIHTEAIMIDSVWEKIKLKVASGEVNKWYIMTPENYEYFKSNFNIKASKEKLSNIMKERYLWMKKQNQKLELHVHLSQIMNNMTLSEQEKLISKSIKWMKNELETIPSEFVPGWWAFNKDTETILKKLNLKLITPKDYDFVHDYNWIL